MRGGRQIKQCALQDSQVIAIGDCRIEYVAGDDQHDWYCDIDPTDNFEPHDADPAPPRRGLDGEIQSLELEPVKTTKSPGRRRAGR